MSRMSRRSFSRDFGWGVPAGAGMGKMPRVDVSETENEIRTAAELPGVEEKDVEVVLSNGRLTIKGEKKQEKEARGEEKRAAGHHALLPPHGLGDQGPGCHPDFCEPRHHGSDLPCTSGLGRK